MRLLRKRVLLKIVYRENVGNSYKIYRLQQRKLYNLIKDLPRKNQKTKSSKNSKINTP